MTTGAKDGRSRHNRQFDTRSSCGSGREPTQPLSTAPARRSAHAAAAAGRQPLDCFVCLPALLELFRWDELEAGGRLVGWLVVSCCLSAGALVVAASTQSAQGTMIDVGSVTTRTHLGLLLRVRLHRQHDAAAQRRPHQRPARFEACRVPAFPKVDHAADARRADCEQRVLRAEQRRRGRRGRGGLLLLLLRTLCSHCLVHQEGRAVLLELGSASRGG
jgi:hypothetical protein